MRSVAIFALSLFVAPPSFGDAAKSHLSNSSPENVTSRFGQPTLWNDLVAGMTGAEVSARYPKKTTVILPGCEARVVGKFAAGRLAEVDLSASRSDSAARCGDTIEATLITKYGTPEISSTPLEGTCGLLERFRSDGIGHVCKDANSMVYIGKSVYFAWISNGLSVTLIRQEFDDTLDQNSWKLVYRQALASDPVAAAKL